jgi:hypothetical protein
MKIEFGKCCCGVDAKQIPPNGFARVVSGTGCLKPGMIVWRRSVHDWLYDLLAGDTFEDRDYSVARFELLGSGECITITG